MSSSTSRTRRHALILAPVLLAASMLTCCGRQSPETATSPPAPPPPAAQPEPSPLPSCTTSQEQGRAENEQSVRQRSKELTTALAQHDTNAIKDLYSSDAQFTAAGGKWSGEDVSGLFPKIWGHRPGITWLYQTRSVHVACDSQTASETGLWTESWNEPDGSVKLQGEYARLWVKSARWQIHGELGTPLTCTGDSSYCS